MGLGTVITLGMNFTGPDVGKLPQLVEIDPIEAAGSLLLIETNHPLKAIPTGVPASGAMLTNLLKSRATKVLGTPNTDSEVYSVFESATHGKVERSRKGGIHVIQTELQTTADHGFQLRIPTAIVAYMQANPSHQFYVSQWGKTTKPESSSQSAVAGVSGSAPSSFGFVLQDGNSAGGGPTLLGLRAVVEQKAGVPNFRNAAVTAFHTDFTGGVISAKSAALFEVGNILVPNRATSKGGKHGAQIFYRGYIEDLTVSGRTYAQVDALDLAEYQKQVLAPGGRYYDDTTPTAP